MLRRGRERRETSTWPLSKQSPLFDNSVTTAEHFGGEPNTPPAAAPSRGATSAAGWLRVFRSTPSGGHEDPTQPQSARPARSSFRPTGKRAAAYRSQRVAVARGGDDGDEAPPPEFIASTFNNGMREGYKFALGKRGLGYYRARRPNYGTGRAKGRGPSPSRGPPPPRGVAACPEPAAPHLNHLADERDRSAPGGPAPPFEPCAQFSGRRAGAVFKRGGRGLGYYRDDDYDYDRVADAAPAAPMTTASVRDSSALLAPSIIGSPPPGGASGACCNNDDLADHDPIHLFDAAAPVGVTERGAITDAMDPNNLRRFSHEVPLGTSPEDGGGGGGARKHRAHRRRHTDGGGADSHDGGDESDEANSSSAAEEMRLTHALHMARSASAQALHEANWRPSCSLIVAAPLVACSHLSLSSRVVYSRARKQRGTQLLFPAFPGVNVASVGWSLEAISSAIGRVDRCLTSSSFGILDFLVNSHRLVRS